MGALTGWGRRGVTVFDASGWAGFQTMLEG